jgi:hypothetical protein
MTCSGAVLMLMLMLVLAWRLLVMCLLSVVFSRRSRAVCIEFQFFNSEESEYAITYLVT